MMMQYGLIGYPLGHSFSKHYFNAKFEAEGIQARYELFPLKEIGQFAALISSNPALKGLNVTIPYKQAVISCLDELSDEAAAIGAVNVIGISSRENRVHLKGWNTDAGAFEQEIAHFTRNSTGRALVLGNGGAAAAAVYALRKLGWQVNQAVRREKGQTSGYILFSDITVSYLKEIDLIVNSTPVGMFPATGEMPPIPPDGLSERHDVFDMIYNPDVTLLMQEARKRGARTINGLGMLYRQAELAWEIWTGCHG